jgi:hypothetical protein
MKRPYYILFMLLLLWFCTGKPEKEKTLTNEETSINNLKISENGRFFETENGKPFFWLGDTGWLLFGKLNRQEAEQYLEDRKEKGFNVIQVMVLHTMGAKNFYGDSALINKNAAHPNVTEGSGFSDSTQYDFWDHVDFIVDKAAEKGIYMAMVPVWGSNVKDGKVNRKEAAIYATFLAERYKNRKNIIWLNGGDIKGSDSIEVWKTIGNTLNEKDPNHLITFHPRGRMQSSMWFHHEPWLDFNMFQSGHRRYDQDTTDLKYGEDNWKYIQADYKMKPNKPSIDGEPSYEKIPQGLHDTLQPLWSDNDVRRYGYWSVFGGAPGFTYGHNSVMQMLKKGETEPAYGAKELWVDALNAPGAKQMIYLKQLMLAKPYFERVPDQTLIADQGEKYNYLASTRGKNYALIYTYTGRNFNVNLDKVPGKNISASWYNPRNGEKTELGTFINKDLIEFNPPEQPEDGNDWVLELAF